MTSEPPADDRSDLTAWVQSIVVSIDSRSHKGRDYMLARLLYTAWPTRCGQDQ